MFSDPFRDSLNSKYKKGAFFFGDNMRYPGGGWSWIRLRGGRIAYVYVFLYISSHFFVFRRICFLHIIAFPTYFLGCPCVSEYFLAFP